MDDNDDYRPWEAPGAQRLDVLPHRGRLLGRLCGGSLVCLAFAICLFPAAFLGLILGGTAVVLALLDLGEIGRGVIDPSGRGQAWTAVVAGSLSAALNLLVLLLWTREMWPF